VKEDSIELRYILSGVYFESPTDGDGDSNDAGDESSILDDDVLGLGDSTGDDDANSESDNDSADGELSQAELLKKVDTLAKTVSEWERKYGKQTDELGELRKKLARTASKTKDDKEGDGSSGREAALEAQIAELKQQVSGLSQNAAATSDYFEQQRLAQNFTPQERKSYEPLVVEMAAKLNSGAMSLEEVLNFAVRGTRTPTIVALAEKRGAERQLEKLREESSGRLPIGKSANITPTGTAPRKRDNEIGAEDALAKMYPERYAKKE